MPEITLKSELSEPAPMLDPGVFPGIVKVCAVSSQ
jgi:hypothetical protein